MPSTLLTRCLDDRLRHWVSTIAGSTRTTRGIAANAETVHITTVTIKKPSIKTSVMTTCNALVSVSSTTAIPINAAMEKPMMALISA